MPGSYLRRSADGAPLAPALFVALVLAWSSNVAAFRTAPYLPLQYGSTWTYRYDGTTLTRTVLGTGTVNGAPAYVLGDSPSGGQWYLSNDAQGIRQHGLYEPGVYLAGFGYVVASEIDAPPKLLAAVDATLGIGVTTSGSASFFYSGIGSFPLSYTTTATPIAFETVSVPAGTFANALNVRVVTRYQGTIAGPRNRVALSLNEDETIWLVPGIGAVKYASSLVETATPAVGAPSTSSESHLAELVASSMIVTTPQAFAFTPVFEATPGALTTSEAVTIRGFTVPVAIAVTGGSYSLDGGPFTSSPGTIDPGQSVRLQIAAAATPAARTSVTLTVGGVSAAFEVTTALPAGPNSAVFLQSQPGDYIGGGITRLAGGPSYSASFNGDVYSLRTADLSDWWYLRLGGVSNAPLVAGMYTNAVRFGGISGQPTLDFFGNGRGCGAVTGRFVVLDVAYDDLGVVQSLAVNFEQHCEGGTAALFGQFRYQSAVPIDYHYVFPPNPFSFAAKSGADFFTAVNSDPVTVSGIATSAPISVSGGSYRVNDGAFTSVAGSVHDGDRITAQVTTTGDSAAQSCVTVTIGGVAAPFCATTAAYIAPAPFAFTALTGTGFNQTVISEALTLALATPVPVGISGGSYNVNGGAYTSAPGIVRNGDRITVRLVTSGTAATQTCATLTAGGVSGQFCGTTLSYSAPDARRIVPILLDD